LSQHTFVVNGTASPSRPTTRSGCCGCCVICSASPDPSTAAASTSARPAPATSTARRSTRARCPCRRSARTTRSPPSKGSPTPPLERIIAAIAKVEQVRAEGRRISDTDLDEIRNICRCGTYSRIRDAVKSAAGRPAPGTIEHRETFTNGRGRSRRRRAAPSGNCMPQPAARSRLRSTIGGRRSASQPARSTRAASSTPRTRLPATRPSPISPRRESPPAARSPTTSCNAVSNRSAGRPHRLVHPARWAAPVALRPP
jgi:hypothetical protein